MPTEKTDVFEKYDTDEAFRRHVEFLFASIAENVDIFCEEFRAAHPQLAVTLEKWVRDLPIWQIRWQEKHRANVIQIAPTQSDTVTGLAVSGFLYEDNERTLQRHSLPKPISQGMITDVVNTRNGDEAPLADTLDILNAARVAVRRMTKKDLTQGTLLRQA